MAWQIRSSSCVTPWRLSLDDHDLASSSQNMVVDKRNDSSTINPIHNQNLPLPSPKCNSNRKLNTTVDNKDKEGFSAGNDSSWSLSADEDYIVFSIREDGTLDVVEDRNSSVDRKHKNSRPVSRKLEYCEDTEQVGDDNMFEKRSNSNQLDIDQDCMTPSREDEEKEIVDIEESEMVPADSRDSNKSEGSRGSFAFPVLGLEWIGSPVQMPKSEDMHRRKQKIRSLRFLCCKF